MPPIDVAHQEPPRAQSSAPKNATGATQAVSLASDSFKEAHFTALAHPPTSITPCPNAGNPTITTAVEGNKSLGTITIYRQVHGYETGPRCNR